MPGARRLALTLGDPRGIGPEVVRAALADAQVRAAVDPVVVGPRGAGVTVDEAVGDWSGDGDLAAAGALSGRAIERAVALAQSGAVEGIVTGPIDKAALLAGGYAYPGHTEMLAALTASRVAMLLASERLRVVLATTHIRLRDVPDALTHEAIVDVATVTRAGLQAWFGLAAPRIALCALNPHAGDGGRFGDEDMGLAGASGARGGAGRALSGRYRLRPGDAWRIRRGHCAVSRCGDDGDQGGVVRARGERDAGPPVPAHVARPRDRARHCQGWWGRGGARVDSSSMIAATLLCARIAARIASAAPRLHW